jgi:hypothetical protein
MTPTKRSRQPATDPTRIDATINADSDHAVGCMRVHHSFRARINARSARRATTSPVRPVRHAGRAGGGRGDQLRVRVEGAEPGRFDVCAGGGRVGSRRGAAGRGWVRKSHQGERWLDELLVALRANRDRLGTLLAEHVPLVRWRPEDVQAT